MVRFYQAIAGLLLSTAGIISAVAPCGQVAEAQKQQKQLDPNADKFNVTAHLAHECLVSVPFRLNDGLRLIDTLPLYWDWQSTQDFLADPPEGYPLPPTDLKRGLAKIRERAVRGGYRNEYEFQNDVESLVRSVHDGHFWLPLDLISFFIFRRTEIGSLVSLSDDGKKFPKLYSKNDLSESADAPAIKTIDGQDAIQWMENSSLEGLQQDLDALYNGMFLNLPLNNESSLGAFRSRHGIYTGDNTKLVYEDGTTKEAENYAFFTQDLTGVTDGDSFYEKFCTGRDNSGDLLRAGKAEEKYKEHHFFIAGPIPSQNSQPPAHVAARDLPPVPKPDYETPDGSLAGYFLDGQHSNTAILHLRNFGGEANTSQPLMDFSETTTKFLEGCRKTRKKKLIIDVSGNPGGVIFLGYDVFKQVLPEGKIETPSNMRAIEQLNITGSKINYLLSHPQDPKAPEAKTQRNDIFDIDVYTNTDGSKFPSWAALYGPEELPQGMFTHPTLWDLNNTEASERGGIVVSGYGDRSHIAPQAFKTEDIVIVTDGICASTCSIFTDLMRRHGVKFIAVGGRPRPGPMQAVGGVKGAQVLNFGYLHHLATYIYDKLSTDEERLQLDKTQTGEMYNKGSYVLGRLHERGKDGTINFRNAVYTEDKQRIPRQFVYEPAECKMFFTREALFDPKAWWGRIAQSWWGDKSLCI
ncbi:hypothetical protein MGYG_03210 [Nannizzia gypsea CBS 118893]|uniref:Uncharacterized protein n=1 Tax=Arthroderma gypseum (strain ATCC MYA-4604 / CBS 118893) TaxID=535722 RepID=E4URE4_ARTGP|nr:hypothetical protein MGYG_03210 [Nannizzia gypsea CBS 118893]EFR00207.1 hypothetical protein MGYG_03210 [Nannizzia gypsea CBS 118893]